MRRRLSFKDGLLTKRTVGQPGSRLTGSPNHAPRDHIMNKNQIKGNIKETAGKVQQKTGAMVGSSEQQLKGIQKQADGKMQKAVGDAQEAVKDASHK
jgi:uncharacterized protein YjbJ (UPF0337 family)